MFSPSPRPGSRAPAAMMYRDVNARTALEGASPHRLVAMLYQAVAGEIAAARGALTRGDVAEKGRAIGHAVRIVEEGLMAPLDMQGGGAIAVNLRDLYQFVIDRLTLGNLRCDDTALADCARVIEAMTSNWEAIGPQVDLPARAAA